MKRLFIFILLIGSTAMAGRVDEIGIMAMEDAEFTLGLNAFMNYEVTYQDFTTPEKEHDLAVKTEITLNKVDGTKHVWTCVTQFVKTPKFFEITKTDCL
ncbi:hypothetical protein ACES2L_15815 [Bdellovibrio bacteriovorus]|uniref:Uncharacterized protein n=1 Tax=Bdellovibrio reynosensis TaxID=2835041 RepID=A0ABY4C9X1_9BACT|nr:hypothetical protein [Bdellovibrio reynosensis]UOF00481.1 hypothetical protein MNR06_12305 [Bdellovibrio reynosensis]